MKKNIILSAALMFFGLTAQAQTKITFDSDDYKAISVYDSWEKSPFRTGALQGNAAVASNPDTEIDAVLGTAPNATGKVVAFQRSRHGSNTYGVRIDLKEPIRMTKQLQYIHVMTYLKDKPAASRMMVIGLGNRLEESWNWQTGEDEQFWATTNTAIQPQAGWQDIVVSFKGFSYSKEENANSGIDIHSLIIVPDVRSPHADESDWVAYFDEIVVDDNPDKRFSTEEYALTYDEESKCWTGKADFCSYSSIIPNRFQVTWKHPDGSVGSGQEEYVDPRVAVDEDHTSGALLILSPQEAGPYELDLASATAVKTVTNALGEEISWTESYSEDKRHDVCNFTVEPGEFYTVELNYGGFRDWPKKTELTIFVESDGAVRNVEYFEYVQFVDSSTFTDWTDSTFESAVPYQTGDVLLIDEATAVTVTGAKNGVYTYTAAGMDEVYRTLELSGFTGTEEVIVTLGETEEELEARFRESELYALYLQTLAETAAAIQGTKEYEGKIDEDTTFKVSLNYTVDAHQATLKPEIKLTTSMKTKLPNKQEEETTIEMVLSVEVLEDLDYHIRSLNDDRNIQSYLLISDETITTELSITASIGEEDGSSSREFDGYFAEKLRSNFLEKLKKEPSKAPFELLKDARISTMVYPGIFLYARPSVEVEWNFFGEVYLKGTMVEKGRKGISLIHLGDRFLGSWDDWNIRKFTDASAQDRSFSASTGFHMTAFVYPALRIGLGLSVVKVLDLEVWAKAGVKVDFDGHGEITFETKKPVDVEAELLVEVSLESSAGVGGYVNIGKKRLALEFAQFKLWEKSLPIKQFGFGLMPTEFATIEEEPIGVASESNLKRLIDLRLDCQNFKSVGGISEEPKVLDLERYTFTLVSGDNVTVNPDGQIRIHDTSRRTEFEVKVTYTGFAKNYRLWKIVPMVYLPANITLTKNTPDGPATCVVKVIDITATAFAMENKMPMYVFGLNEENSIVKAISGEFAGTKVTV